MFEIELPDGSFTHPVSNIFYELCQAERNSGRGKKHEHLWTILHPGKEVAGTFLTFPPQKMMKKLSSKLPRMFGRNAVLTFELKKDAMTLNDKTGLALTLSIHDFDISNMPSVVAYIHPRMLRHLYGECSLKVFSGPNSEDLSLMITNADGWSTHLKCEPYDGYSKTIERQRT